MIRHINTLLNMDIFPDEIKDKWVSVVTLWNIRLHLERMEKLHVFWTSSISRWNRKVSLCLCECIQVIQYLRLVFLTNCQNHNEKLLCHTYYTVNLEMVIQKPGFLNFLYMQQVNSDWSSAQLIYLFVDKDTVSFFFSFFFHFIHLLFIFIERK